jgi:hypothetical protein
MLPHGLLDQIARHAQFLLGREDVNGQIPLWTAQIWAVKRHQKFDRIHFDNFGAVIEDET